MKQLSINLSILIVEAVDKKQPCFVCSSELDKTKSRIGYRIRPTPLNIIKHGARTINHFMNHEVCCSSVCAEKITNSWETKFNEKKVPELVSRIKQDISEYENYCKKLR